MGFYNKWTGLVVAATACVPIVVAISGCDTIENNKETELVSLPDYVYDAKKIAAHTLKSSEDSIIPADVIPPRAEGKDETKLPERDQTNIDQPLADRYPQALIAAKIMPNDYIKVPKTGDKVVFEWEAMALSDVVIDVADYLKVSPLVDPKIQGAVTLSFSKKMTNRELWQMFVHILRVSGAYATFDNGLLNVRPISEMNQETKIGQQSNVAVDIIQLQKCPASTVISNITPFVTKGGTVTEIKRINALMIVDTPSNMPKVHALIKKLDAQWQTSWPMVSIHCHKVDTGDIIEELKKILPILGLDAVYGDAKGTEVQMKIADIPRLQVMVASAPTKDAIMEVKKWVSLLDRVDKTESQQGNFYNVRHGNVDDLMDAIGVFFNGTGKSSSKKKSISSRANGASTAKRSSSKGSSSRNSANSSNAAFNEEIVYHSIPGSNQITIQSTPRTFALMKAFLERWDTPPRQVLIQAMIVDVTLTEGMQQGFTYALRKNAKAGSGHYTALGGLNNLPDILDSANSISLGNPTGIGALFQDQNFAINYIASMAGTKNTSVLSTPQILALSGEEAKIAVGEQRSIIESYTYGSTSGTSSADRANYAYKKAGVELTVTPYITANNEVTLEVDQQVDSFEELTAAEVAANDGRQPTIKTRSLKSKMVLPDGKTVLLGGIINNNNNDYETGVPWLKDIPGLGWLFKYETKTQAKTELLVLITVNVMDSKSELQGLLQRYKHSVGQINKVFPSRRKKLDENGATADQVMEDYKKMHGLK